MTQKRFSTCALIFGLLFFAPVLAKAQFGNTISGYVFGLKRQPISDVTVELYDDYSRSIGRTKTNASGRYVFSRVSSGRFRVKVLSFSLDYEEQEQEVEIQNLNIVDASGRSVTSGLDNAQRDFYLKLRRNNQFITRAEAVFVQDVPAKARDLCKKGIDLLGTEKNEDGLKELKSAIELFPDYYDAIERLGTEYIKLKHFVPAQILLQRAVEINPRGYKSWYGLAYALYSQNKIDEAIKPAQEAASLNQSSVEVPLLTGVLLRRKKKYEDAEKQLLKAKNLSKDAVPEVHWQLALLYGNNLSRYNEAAKELKLYLKSFPTNKDSENIKLLIKQFEDKAKEQPKN